MTFGIQSLALFGPVILLCVQFYFKPELIQLGGLVSASWPAAPYWSIRAILIAAFIFSVLYRAPTATTLISRSTDPYAKERALRDPLLGLRALACANVLFGHWFLVVFAPSDPAPNHLLKLLRRLMSFSPWSGVWIFFALSGYLIGKGFITGRHSVNREGLKRFYRNRMLRIVPIYLTAVFIVATLVTPSAIDIRTQASWDTLLSTILFDVTAGGVIGALWSISTELQFYLLAPLIFIGLNSCVSRPRLLTGLGFCICLIFGLAKFFTLRVHPELWHNRIYFPLLSNLDCFVLGMITAILVQDGHKKRVTFRSGLPLGVGLAVVSQILFSLWSFSTPYLAFGPAVTASLTCLVIYVFELAERKEASWFTRPVWRLSSLGGAMTYCIYVFHEPVLISMRRLYPPTIEFLASVKALCLGFFVVMAFAYLFYVFVESRFDMKRT